MSPRKTTSRAVLAAAALLPAVLLTASCERNGNGKTGRAETKSHRAAHAVKAPGRSGRPRARVESLLRECRDQHGMIDALRAQCAEMGAADLDEVFALLASGPPEGASPSLWHLAANEIMEQLKAREDLPEVAPRIFSLASSPDAPPVIRDYAVQHYLLAEMQTLRGIPETAPEKRSEAFGRLLDNMESLLAENQSAGTTLFGTSLMGLAALAGELRGGELRRLRQRAAPFLLPAISGAAPATAAEKVSAIQAAARIGIPEAAPLLAAIARDEKAGFSERLSAIAALRHYPDHADAAWLEQLAESRSRLRFAARETLKHLKTDSSPSNETK